MDVAQLCTMLEVLGFILDACKPAVVALAYDSSTLGSGGGETRVEGYPLLLSSGV